ncbi:MAG TPA: hypothetical protein EYP56_20805 [Planctomycetaceae bacterium]|nr:hypothetical protein [Planctomycetaceae bacterium]
MPTFVHSALLWALPVVGLPVLIHLINLMRHRRVRWAAMEFLLASQRKNRTWVFLKQLLLLLLRMAVLAAAVLMVARPRMPERLGGLLRTGRTHHLVLLDDSFSMSDRWAHTSAWDEAKGVVRRIGAAAVEEAWPQRFTLLRFSRAAVSDSARPDLLAERVDRQFLERLDGDLDRMEVSQSAAGPLAALETIVQLVADAADEQSMVYLVSDFRSRDWDEPGQLKEALSRLSDLGARLHLIRCVHTARDNLAIARLVPGRGIRAADVPLRMEVTVRNFGRRPARRVTVLVEADGSPQPAVEIEQIEPGGSVTQSFSVRFATAGQHHVAARLEIDPVAADNFRYAVVEVPAEQRVLLVDGDPGAAGARYLQAALDPGGPVSTGVRPRIVGPRYLSLHPLQAFDTIYLLDVPHLEPAAVEALESFVASGGGLAIFLGPRSDPQLFNEQLYRRGRGLMPVPVAGPRDLLVDRLRKAPDLEVTDHPIFHVLAGRRNSFVAMVNVERYFAVAEQWRPEADPAVRVIARLRNGAPLAVEKPFGQGRVVAFVTTAAPEWNNWARGNPSFVVAMLEMQAYLAGPPPADTSQLVGTPLQVTLDPARYAPPVRLLPPDGTQTGTIQAQPDPDGLLKASFAGTDTSGIYRVELSPKGASPSSRSYAVNVDPSEGDLAMADPQTLAARLRGVRYEWIDAAEFRYGRQDYAARHLGHVLLYALVVLLVGEQLLARSASYHPAARAASLAHGGAR